MKCIAYLSGDTRCTNNALVNSSFCRQHKQMHDEKEAEESVLPPDLEDIMASYVIDWDTYSKLIQIYPNRYSIEKWKLLEEKYENLFSSEIYENYLREKDALVGEYEQTVRTYRPKRRRIGAGMKFPHPYAEHIGNTNREYSARYLEMYNRYVGQIFERFNELGIFEATGTIDIKILGGVVYRYKGYFRRSDNISDSYVNRGEVIRTGHWNIKNKELTIIPTTTTGQVTITIPRSWPYTYIYTNQYETVYGPEQTRTPLFRLYGIIYKDLLEFNRLKEEQWRRQPPPPPNN